MRFGFGFSAKGNMGGGWNIRSTHPLMLIVPRLVSSPLLDANGDSVLDSSGNIVYDNPQIELVDTIGVSSRPVQKKWHLLGDGAGYLAHAAIVGTETVTSKEGTATITIAAGRVNVGVGTLWSLVLSNGSRYEYPTMIGESFAVIFDVSGNGRHLVLTGYTLATAVVKSLTDGSNWLNLNGYTVADGSQYLSPVSFGLIPNDVLIPNLADGSGCAAYEVQ